MAGMLSETYKVGFMSDYKYLCDAEKASKDFKGWGFISKDKRMIEVQFFSNIQVLRKYIFLRNITICSHR